MTGNSDSPVISVDRALRILMRMGEMPRGITLEELAGDLDVPKSTLHRLLGALKHRGFASQPEPNGPYFIGSQLLATAFRFHDDIDLRSMVHPLLADLRRLMDETVHVAILDAGEVVYLDKVEASGAIKLSSVIGGRNPAHSTGVGKALLAWTYPTDEALRAWATPRLPLRAATRHTLTSVPKLAAELEEVRGRGYATDLEENELGLRCVAVPLFLGRSAPAAAISVTGLKSRMTSARMAELAEALRSRVAEWAGAAG
ncbi:IclR family transcriptional regulator [Embleya sp. NPDC050154]|uniref:IclR family transcriptional regulator n=1 Tax=unclassified Embleya TaxID=2699296 RepID=UPI0037B4025E